MHQAAAKLPRMTTTLTPLRAVGMPSSIARGSVRPAAAEEEDFWSGYWTGQHRYTIRTPICSVDKDEGCSVDAVFALMRGHRDYQMPNTGDGPVVDGQVTQIPVLGKVKNIINEQDRSITNQTEPDHLLHDGKVVRSVVQEGDEVVVRTVGTGSGWLPMFNNWFAPSLWGSVDHKLEEGFRKKEQ